MRGLGQFQISQTKNGDPRVPQLCSTLRSALDLIESILLHPYSPPVEAPPTPRVRPAALPELKNDKIAYSIKEIRNMTGISRAKIYSDIQKKRLRSSKAGGRTLILSQDLHAWIDGWTKQ